MLIQGGVDSPRKNAKNPPAAMGTNNSSYVIDGSIAKSKKRMAAEMVILTTKLHHIEKDQAARESIQEELSSLEASYAKEMEKLKRKKRACHSIWWSRHR
jgi:hypothetical protein